MAPLAHTLALLAMTVATTAIKVVPLDMAPNSFDDQYWGCSAAMTAALPDLKLSELQQNKNFTRVWEKATDWWQQQGSCVSPLLPKDQAIALRAYTMNDVYEEFNKAVREAGCSRQEYRDKFQFKALHFLLTQALATLRDTQGQGCRDVVRGVRNVSFEAKPGDAVRFGQFASTSLCRGTACGFGTDTVFEVHTCHGADIRNYSYYPNETEVLIPPFETFKVTKVTQEGNQTQIRLRSTGNRSNYNCEWLRGDVTKGTTWGGGDTHCEHGDTHGGSVSMVSFHLGGLLLATTALAVATGIL